MSRSISPVEFEHRPEADADDSWRQMIRRAQLGDRNAFEELYLRSARWLLKRVRRIVIDGNAENVLVETYIQAWRTIETCDWTEDPVAWLEAIAEGRALEHLRAQTSRGLCIEVDKEVSSAREVDGPRDARCSAAMKESFKND